MKTGLIVATIAVLGAGVAYAGGGHFTDADSDGDGYVSLQEMKAAHNARIEEHFARADADGDGLLSEAERRAAHDKMRARHRERREHMRELRRDPERIVERLDIDGSGSVSLDEFEGRRFSPDAETFYAADNDGNGELDADELGALMASHHAGRKADRGRVDQE